MNEIDGNKRRNNNNTYRADISSLCILCNSEKKSDLSAAYLVLLKPLEETRGCLFILFTKFSCISLSHSRESNADLC